MIWILTRVLTLKISFVIPARMIVGLIFIIICCVILYFFTSSSNQLLEERAEKESHLKLLFGLDYVRDQDDPPPVAELLARKNLFVFHPFESSCNSFSFKLTLNRTPNDQNVITIIHLILERLVRLIWISSVHVHPKTNMDRVQQRFACFLSFVATQNGIWLILMTLHHFQLQCQHF